jgi:hypothetical protein
MKLYVLSDYRNRELSFQAGSVIENADPRLVEYLLADSPESFSKTPPGAKGLDAPPQDKMIGDAEYSKMTMPMLKSLLKAKGLPVGGKKPELVERLENAG